MALKDQLRNLPLVGTALAVQERYKADAGNQLAAGIAFFGFLSLFPLLLVALSLAGFVLAGDAAAQRQVVDAITSAIPGFRGALGESQVGDAVDSLIANRGGVGLIGLVSLLFSGLRVVDAASVATGRVYRVEVAENAVRTRVRELGVLFLLGVLVVAGAALASLTGAAGALAPVLGLVAALAVDTGLFLTAYRYVNAGPPRITRLWPGAFLGATGWVLLKTFGATFVSDKVAEANALYGTLGGVFALLFLLFLGARLYLYGAELNAVLGDLDGAGGEAEAESLPEPTGRDATREDDVDLRTDQPWPADGRATAPVVGLSPAPRPDEPSTAVSDATTSRLRAADERNRREVEPRPVQRAIAFVLATGLVAVLVKLIGLPGQDE